MGYFDINTIDKEEFIWKEFFKTLLLREGYTEEAEDKAKHAFQIFNILEIIRPYPESEHVFQKLKKHGFLIGIVSNCFPTLRESLSVIGLDKYIDCFVNSSSAGFRKPDPAIFRITLDQLGINAHHAIFIDNTEENIVAARNMNITSFLIDRTLPCSDFQQYKINNLNELLTFLNLNSNE